MKDCRQFYIDGKWISPTRAHDLTVINPANEAPIATVSLGSSADVDKAVAAAKKAFESYSETTREERLALLRRIIDVYQSRKNEMAEAISEEMGAPISLSRAAQAPVGLSHFSEVARILGYYEFERLQGSTLMRKEPIGVCGLITPWNWPMNQIACKVAPGLAAGCTMVLKPSEIAPLSASLFTQILHDSGLPRGVFNMLHGEGPIVGSAIASQSCNAPSRMLVPRSNIVEAAAAAKSAAEAAKIGDPFLEDTGIGPLASKAQYEKVQRLILQGIQEGAKLITGGLGRPEGISKGYFVKPTVFSDVNNEMAIAREEIFGPVLCIIPYEDEDDAVRIANDTPFGLSGYVTSRDIERARRVSKRIRSGNIHINGARLDFRGCFGGYKQSGNGREWGEAGLEEFLELKAIFGFEPGLQ